MFFSFYKIVLSPKATPSYVYKESVCIQYKDNLNRVAPSESQPNIQHCSFSSSWQGDSIYHQLSDSRWSIYPTRTCPTSVKRALSFEHQHTQENSTFYHMTNNIQSPL